MPNQSSSSEESDLPNVAVKKSNFRIRVSLQRFYTDIRSRCFVLVSRHKRVRWLEHRLRKLFSIEGHFYLLSQGHLLPSSEPLALLNPDDEVQVIPQELSEDALDAGMTNHNEGNISITPTIDGREGSRNCDIKFNNGFEMEQTIDNNICSDLEGEEEEDLDQREHVIESVVKKQKDFKFIVDDGEKLQDKKKEALALLENQLGEAQNEICDRVGSRRKRKRVRHRKRPQTNDSFQEILGPPDSVANSQETFVPSDNIADFSSPSAIISNSPSKVSKALSTSISVSAEIAADTHSHICTELQLATGASGSEQVSRLVARNNSVEPRKPRVIYALDNF